ncbi:serine/threonine protein kinase [Caldanaerobius fijiensis DSM 17918]|uniref:non-specific serine/threonine protein kinase n=1 Tax=Caldanaerobius fijiensis DSM 17918 TaxID=1121256 RepID=A0A1M4ZR32_9THEO|nr:Stk1 family PASTA domain-containing Ser/Thr kinase [Caldanaerobius fijiensis]SHF20499.1 serine/threonine protein kinase [Caldanaerobius fijiensis DSM 17918]
MIGRLLGNRYEVLEKIGEGGMGIVYKARCNLLNRYVAIKVLRPEYANDENFIERFKRESQAAASLSHPNIVNIYDVGCDDGIYYIVMEYVHGKTLKKVIKENNGPLPVDYAVDIARQVASALDHAHKRGIVHRDVKPQNILITDDGRAKVTDFGIARAGGNTTLTYTGNIIGTAQYFSPEQAKGGYIDAKSDVYSLGIVLYEMVTGRLPFDGESPISVALKHIQEEIIQPRKLNPSIPPALNMIIMKATQKDQNARYQSAEELLTDLGRFLKDPYGDFVKINDSSFDDPTRVMKIDDDMLKKVQRRSSDAKNENNGKGKSLLRKVFISIAITALMLIALGAVSAAGVYYLNNSMRVKEITVPSLIGLNAEDARSLLQKKHLKAKEVKMYNDQYSPGVVFKQDPEHGTSVKENYVVTLYVSKGVQKVAIPDVTGIDYRDAQIRLDNAGLNSSIKYVYDDRPKNIVISQYPSPDAGTVKKGTTIVLTVSKGPNKVTVPSLVGLKLDEAKTLLQNSQLKLGNVKYQEDTGPEDVVLTQSVDANQSVDIGTSIDLVVSKKPAQPQQPTGQQQTQGQGQQNNQQAPSNQGQQSNPQLITKNIIVNLPKSDKPMSVELVMVQNNQSTVVYNGINNYADSPLSIPVSASGKVILQLYIDGKLQDSREVDFR